MTARRREMASPAIIAPLVAACCLVPAGTARSDAGVLHAAVAQPTGYRMERYDDEVPDALEGATRVTAREVRRLLQDGQAVIVDVLPAQRKPEGLPDGQRWMPVPHAGIPGALWLPDTGYGALSAAAEQYFRTHLDRVSGGDHRRALIFYCRMNCWMSWNAAKRALSYGYTNVYWFADGLDDWRFESFPLEPLEPAPGER